MTHDGRQSAYDQPSSNMSALAESRAAHGQAGLPDGPADRRLRLLRETLHRAHRGPHAMLRTVSEVELAFLLDPLLGLLDDVDELRSGHSRTIFLPEEAS